MKKRVMSILLCMVLIMSAVPMLGVPVQAAGYKLFFNANTTATVDNIPPTMTGDNTYEIPAYYYSEEDGAVHNGVPTRYKYTFLGWSENKNASDPDYVPGNTIILSQNTTLYAVWKFGIKSAQTLTTNGNCVITTDFPGQEQWVKIRLEDSANYWSETGTSQIWSAAEGDPKAELYDAEGDFLDWNDNTSLGYNDQNFRIPYSFSKSTTYYLSVTTDYFSSVYDDTVEAYMPETVIVNLDKVQNRYNARFYDTFADEGSGSLWRTIALFDSYIGIVPSYGYNEEQSMHIDNFLGWGTNAGDVLFPGDELYPKSQTLTTVLEEWEEVPTGVVCGTIAMLSFGRQISWYSFTPLTSGTYHALLWEGDNSLKCSIWEGDEKKFSDTYSNYDSDTGLNDYSVYLRSGKTYYFGVRPNVYFEGVVDMEYVFEICRTATLSYNANGGSGGPSSQSGAYKYTIPSTKPTRSGYTFTGWSTTPNNEEDFLYEPGNIVEVNAAATLYAQWTPNVNHTVTYNYSYNGGTSSTKTSASVAENVSIDLTPTATKPGWTFVGWNTDPNATSKLTSLKMGTSNVTLYAIYKKTITGTFIDYSGATKKTTIKTVDIYNKATSGYLAAPTQNTYTGWTARGWTTGTSANASYTNSFSVSGDTIYYGLYQRTLTLSYNANGGSSTPSSQSGTQYANSYSISTYSNPSFTLANAISKSGSTFGGWKKGSTSGTLYSAGSSISISESTTMYAYWNNNYTVTFDAQGGSVSPSSRTVASGTTITLPSPSKSYTITFNANGGSVSASSNTVYCSFRNWNTYSSGSGTSYSAGANYPVYSNTTLYAQWTNPTAGSLPSAIRGGYTFDGWYTSSSGGSRMTSSSTISANTVLYAHWTYIPVTAVGCDIVSAPKKTSYIYKENTDTSGTVLNIRYSDGSTKTVSDTSQMTFSGLTTSSVGTKTVIVSCEDVSTSFNITVRYAWWQQLIRIFLLGFLWY